NKWLEESICETGSLFALRRMGEAWKKAPPKVRWKSYASNLTKYAEGRIAEHRLAAGQSLAEWYKANERELRRTSTDRKRNGVVAVKLLELLEKRPEHWLAVHYLNQGDAPQDESFADC